MKSVPQRAAALAAGLTLVLAGCASAAPPDSEKTTLTLGLPSFVIDFPLDPSTIKLFQLAQAVYEPLVMLNQTTNEYEPWLAEEFDVSDDRRTLTLKLREDVDFTDGTHMDAAAVEGWLDFILAQDNVHGQTLGLYGTEATATGEYELEMVAADRPIDSDFFIYLWTVPILSPEVTGDLAALNDAPIGGTGPYLLDERVPGASVSLVANPDYWNPDAVDFESVKFVAFEDNVAALNALKSGQIDATAIDNGSAAEAEASGFTLFEGGGRFVTLVILDNEGAIVPALADVRVRQAINLAFDRQAILDTIDLGFGSVSSQAASSIFPWYVEGGDDAYDYDLEAARTLMADAGYADGFDLTIPTYAGSESAPYEPIVQQSLADIGIRVTYDQYADGADYTTDATAGVHPVILIKDYYTNLSQYVHGYLYDTLFDDHAYELLETAEQGTIDESGEALRELGKYILDEAWFVPVSSPTTLWATVPEIEMIVGDVLSLPELHDYRVAD
jgi:peptide/nickel transport system substrate-binding protein